MKANLHTHTTRCGHAVGADEDYVRAALTQHFDVLGFSDHVPWPYTSGYTHESVRMTVDRLPEYVSAVRALAERYRGQIRVLAGFECEYFPAYMGWLAETAEAYQLDYLILGNHYDESDETGTYFGGISTAEQLSRYVKQTVKGLETGLFTYLAHPDLFMHRWPLGFGAECRAAARDLCDACLALNVPMEYNTHMRYAGKGLPGAGYPCRPFFEIAAAAGVPVVIGLDAHDPAELSNPVQWDLAEREIRETGAVRPDCAALRSFGGGEPEEDGERGTGK